MNADLHAWVEAQLPRALDFMLRSVSCQIVKARPGFGQVISPKPGSIVASPVPASYDPDPDYFFHWFRDSAVIIDALRLAHLAHLTRVDAPQLFADFVRFSLSLQGLDGGELERHAEWRARVAPDFQQFVRPGAELSSIRGPDVYADTRVNPDGTLDISRWARPQHDGPALRLLAVLRWLDTAVFSERDRALAMELVRNDLDFVLARWHTPCFDIWEEELGQHFYTLRVAASALMRAAQFVDSLGDVAKAGECHSACARILPILDGFWSESLGFYRSRTLVDGGSSSKELDIAVILAAIHADEDGEMFGSSDPRMHATLERLDALFDSLYEINHLRGSARGAALGRYAGDVYYSGGAYFFSTLGAAEFCYRAARKSQRHDEWIERGDRYLQSVRTFVPGNGEMAEQFDQRTGAPASARHLAWSYAAFISCALARASKTI